MTDLVIAEYEEIANVADAIRSKTGTTEQMSLSQMATNVMSISSSDIIIDSELSETSTNPVQNKVVAQEILRISESMNNIGGTIEVTSGEPTKENTVVIISPSSETTNIYTSEEVDAKFEQMSEEIADLDEKIATSVKEINEEVNLTLKDGNLILNTGVIKPMTGDVKYCVTEYIDVANVRKCLITGGSDWGNAIYCFYDNEFNVVLVGETSNANNTWVQIKDKEVEVPINATKLVVAGYNSSKYGIKVSVLDGYELIGKKEWSNLKWVVFGDSLTDDRNTKATKRYFDYIAEETGITVLNHGVSGSGYAVNGELALGENTNWMNRVLTLTNVDFDVITFFGSGNDLSSDLPRGTATDTTAETRCGCINITLDNLLSVKPFAKIGIITPTPWQSVTPWGADDSMTKYCDLLIEIAKRRGIPYLDLYRCSQMRPDDEAFRNAFYSRDGGNGVHPDENGHKRFYPQIREFLKQLI